MQRLEDKFERKNESGPKEVHFPSEIYSSLKKRKSCFSPIVRAFGIEVRENLDQE